MNSLKRVSEVNWSDPRFIRAGIIPFIDQGDLRFFGFGIDSEAASIGDLGGHREKIDRDALDAAIREYAEEGLDIFGKLTRESLQDCFVIEGVDTAEILLPIKGSLYRYTELFRNIIGNNTEHEVQDMVWLSRRQLLTVIDNQDAEFNGVKIYHMYDRIRNALHLNRDFI